MRQNKHRNILLVEDDLDDQAFFLDVLKEIDPNTSCHVANNGLEAILHVNTISRKPTLIFLDLNMPFMSGYECLAKLKEDTRFAHIPVIIFTTSNNPVDMEKTQKMGAHYYFSKPSDYIEFKEKLTKVLRGDFTKEFIMF